jgi:Spy/CpxP family protein refolding chaperone
MKKISACMLALAITFSSIAQTGQPNNHKEAKTDKKEFKQDAIDKLNLTDAQKAQIKPINDEFRQKMQDLKKNDNITVKQQREQREALVKEHQEKIKAILTPEQQNQLAQTRQNLQKQEVFRKGFKAGRASEMVKDLNLTPEQTKKVQDLNQSLRTKVQDIQNNNSLTQEQKKEQVKDLMKKHREDIQSLLTKEQKDQLRSRLKNHQQPNGKTEVK